MPVKYNFHSLEDYLISKPLTVDGELNDGWGASFPVKGRELDATVLFADIAMFSQRTKDLGPAETLAFVNHFFAWMTAEGLRGTNAIVDKYIGDEIMIVFSKEFGSTDTFVEAVQTARYISDHDVFNFCPHIGIASGRIIAGYVGTPLKYNCSVFGAPVALAARCAGVRRPIPTDKPGPIDGPFFSSSIVFPSSEWGERDLNAVIAPRQYTGAEGETIEQDHGWELLEPRSVKIKNLPDLEIRELGNTVFHMSNFTAEDRAKKAIESLRRANRCWPVPPPPRYP
jgi:hypothetical protein